MPPTPEHAADAWLAAEASGRAFAASGPWGTASGTITTPPAVARRKWLLGGARAAATSTVALVVPNMSGLEGAERIAVLEDALCAGLMRGGAHVARVRDLALSTPPFDDATVYVAAVNSLIATVAALHPGARPALAGAWLGGAAAAAASATRDDLAFLALVAAPAPEVLSRRTPENEDDPAWATSPTLRLADALANLAPLEAVVQQRRPVLLVNGAVDDGLPATHLESWRAALTATGRSVDALELAFADALLQWRDADGAADEESTQAHDLLADAVGRWTIRTLRVRA